MPSIKQKPDISFKIKNKGIFLKRSIYLPTAPNGLREREFKRELKGVGGRKFGRELKGEGATSTLLSSYILCPPKGEAAIRLL